MEESSIHYQANKFVSNSFAQNINSQVGLINNSKLLSVSDAKRVTSVQYPNNLYSSAFLAANTNKKYQEAEESEEMESSYRVSENAMLVGLRNYENDARSHSYS